LDLSIEKGFALRNRTFTIALAAAATLALGACTKEQPYQIDLPMKELMGHVIDPAAWTFWRTTGWVDDETGTHNRLPTTEEGWLAAETGAVTVAEGANLLMLPGRREDDGDWMKIAKQLYDASMESRQAVIDRDEQKMFDTGGKMYEACVACHAKYLLPKLPPEERDATFAPLPEVAPKDKGATLMKVPAEPPK